MLCARWGAKRGASPISCSACLVCWPSAHCGCLVDPHYESSYIGGAGSCQHHCHDMLDGEVWDQVCVIAGHAWTLHGGVACSQQWLLSTWNDVQDGPHVRLVSRDDEKDVEGRGKLGQSISAARIAPEVVPTVEKLLKEGLPREVLRPLWPFWTKLPIPKSLRPAHPRAPKPGMLQKEMGFGLEPSYALCHLNVKSQYHAVSLCKWTFVVAIAMDEVASQNVEYEASMVVSPNYREGRQLWLWNHAHSDAKETVLKVAPGRKGECAS